MSIRKKIAGGILAFSLASQVLVVPIQALAASPQQIEDTAKNYMGIHYEWGGTTPNGFDCSGFTQFVFNKNGLSLPRTAAEQFTIGQSVNRSDLKKGDLVFFTT